MPVLEEVGYTGGLSTGMTDDGIGAGMVEVLGASVLGVSVVVGVSIEEVSSGSMGSGAWSVCHFRPGWDF